MIKFVLFATLAVCILAQQQQPGPPNPPEVSARAQIVKFSSSPNSGNGEYNFEYELSDGSYRQESGTVQKAGSPDEFLFVQGVYRWTSPEGWMWETRYSADDNGYHAENVLRRQTSYIGVSYGGVSYGGVSYGSLSPALQAGLIG